MTKNTVWNRVTIYGDTDVVKQLMETVVRNESGYACLDFNRITPKPDWVDCDLAAPDNPNPFHDALVSERNQWIGKWWSGQPNAQPVSRESRDNEFLFVTTDEPVPVLMSKLSMIAPDCTITYVFASENWDKCGVYQFADGELTKGTCHAQKSKEAVDLCVDLVCDGVMPDGVVWNSETNEYDY